MKKKIFLGVALAAFVAGGAFALPELKFSAGAGGYFTSDFGGGYEVSYKGETMFSMKTPYFGGGGFAFFDATFAELSLGVFAGGGTVTGESGGAEIPETDVSCVGLDIGLLGKYPFALSDKLTVFPLLGITYRAMLSAKTENEDGDVEEADNPEDSSALWFKFGGGLDFSFTDKLYLHSGLLYGLRLANTFENDLVDSSDKQSNGAADTKTLLGHGLEIKLAVGYRF
jgi:opacity protein-like surface antigen